MSSLAADLGPLERSRELVFGFLVDIEHVAVFTVEIRGPFTSSGVATADQHAMPPRHKMGHDALV